ncbi:anthrone oxygenase family protein [Hymenobacter ruber]
MASAILLWLFVLNLGVAFGAGLYETRIILPQWFNRSAEGYRVDGPAMARTDVGRRFWGPVTTLPLTLLTFANLAMAWSAPGPRHGWWLAAAMLALAERLGTFAFFIPVALRLQRAADDAPTARLVAWWVRLNYGRNLLTLLAWLAALRAFSLPV